MKIKLCEANPAERLNGGQLTALDCMVNLLKHLKNIDK